ncbi:hypothetical protein [Haladaptatus cibarius]|nr:hypothetical protein [Haladaptatus cibarius]
MTERTDRVRVATAGLLAVGVGALSVGVHRSRNQTSDSEERATAIEITSV